MKPESKAAKIFNLAKQLFIKNYTVIEGHEKDCETCTKACIHAAKTFYDTVEKEATNNKF